MIKPFVSPDSFIPKLRSLRADYQEAIKISDLRTAPQPYSLSIFLGATDVNTREMQIQLIDNWLAALNKYLLPTQKSPDAPIFTEEQLYADFCARHILFSLCLFLKSSISNTLISESNFRKLLKEAMGINSNNPLDDKSYAACLLTAQDLLKGRKTFAKINSELAEYNKNGTTQSISREQWKQFKTFVNEQCDRFDKKTVKRFSMTSITVPILGHLCRLPAIPMGYIVGDMAGKSTALLPARYALTAAIGGGMYLVMGPSASVGVMLLAPSYAGRILDTFCGVSVAYIMGAIMDLLGRSAGWMVGITLDMSFQLIYQAFSLIYNYYCQQDTTKLTGISLIDGHRIENGIDIRLVDFDKFKAKNPEYQQYPITFEVDQKQNNLSVIIEGNKTEISLKEKTFLKQLIDLNQQQQLVDNQPGEALALEDVADGFTETASMATLN